MPQPDPDLDPRLTRLLHPSGEGTVTAMVDDYTMADIIDPGQPFATPTPQRSFASSVDSSPAFSSPIEASLFHHRLPPPPSPSPSSFVDSSLSQDSPLQSQSLSQWSQSQSVPSVSQEPVDTQPASTSRRGARAGLSNSRGGQGTHFSQEEENTLIRAMDHHNPKKHKSNVKQGRAWKLVMDEFNKKNEETGLPPRRMEGLKDKWTQISEGYKTKGRVSRGASGVVEAAQTDFERMIEGVLEAEAGHAAAATGRSEALAHRNVCSSIAGTAASRSMSSRAQRAQEASTPSHTGDSDADVGLDVYTTSFTRKRKGQLGDSSIDMMLTQDAANRVADQEHQQKQLALEENKLALQERRLRAEEEHQAKSLQVQSNFVDLGTRLVTTMATDVKGLERRFDSVEAALSSMQHMLTQLVSSGVSVRRSDTSAQPKDASTPRASTPHSQASDATPHASPAKRRRTASASASPSKRSDRVRAAPPRFQAG